MAKTPKNPAAEAQPVELTMINAAIGHMVNELFPEEKEVTLDSHSAVLALLMNAGNEPEEPQA